MATFLITLISLTRVSEANYDQQKRSLSSLGTHLAPCFDDGAKMCFSCASQDAKDDWSAAYEHTLSRPGNFSPICEELKDGMHRIYVTACMTSCVTLVDPQFVFGMRVKQRYIRGCLDTMFTSQHSKRLIQKLIPSSNSLQGEHCRPVVRSELFNNQALRPDNLTLCLCGCDRCNVYPDLPFLDASGGNKSKNQYFGSFWGFIWLLLIFYG